jgi:hypothetical protein
MADEEVGEVPVPVPVPVAVMQLIETGRPMTSVAIRDAIGTLPLPGRERWLAMHAVAKGWAASSPKAALAWARSDATGEYSLEIQARVLRYGIETNPGAASREVEAHPHYTRRLELLYHLGQSWSASDAVAAHQWIETTLAGAAHESALRGFLQEKFWSCRCLTSCSAISLLSAVQTGI